LSLQWASTNAGTPDDPTANPVTFTYDPSVTSATITLTVTDDNGPASKSHTYTVTEPVTPAAPVRVADAVVSDVPSRRTLVRVGKRSN